VLCFLGNSLTALLRAENDNDEHAVYFYHDVNHFTHQCYGCQAYGFGGGKTAGWPAWLLAGRCRGCAIGRVAGVCIGCSARRQDGRVRGLPLG
jgi:hypothetical protein